MEALINEDLTTLENVTPFLKRCFGKGKEIPATSLLQVQQVTNISLPTYDKANYDADKHSLKVTVTDGRGQAFAYVLDACPGLTLNTPPGTKIKITRTIPIQGNLFVLNRNNCEVLGGRVPKLIEKWEIQKKIGIKHDWGYAGTPVDGEGPPPWKPFGYRSLIDFAAIREMKTSDVVNGNKEGKEGEAKTKFDVQRNEAISGVQGTASKEKFQKPKKHLLDKEIMDIMKAGFSQSVAEYAMERFKNTKMAIKFLKDSKKQQQGYPPEPPKILPERKDRRKWNDEGEEREVPFEFHRPTQNISLFGFIENKIKKEEKPVLKLDGPSAHGSGSRDRGLEDSMAMLSTEDSQDHSEWSRRVDGGQGMQFQSNGRTYRGGAGGSRGSQVVDGYRGNRGSGGFRGNRGSGGFKGNRGSGGFKGNRGGDVHTGNRGDDGYRGSRSGLVYRGSGGDDGYRGRGSSDGYETRRGQGPPRDFSESQSTPPHSGSPSFSHWNQDYQEQTQQQRPQTYSDYPPYDRGYRELQLQQYNINPPPLYNLRQPPHVDSSFGNHDMSWTSGAHSSRSAPSVSSNHSGSHSDSGRGDSQSKYYQYGYEGWNPTQSLVFRRKY